MAGMKFEYDEKGSTFLYFILSFFGLCLLPTTYYGWPSAEKPEDQTSRGCRCEPCQQKKAQLKNQDPWKRTKRRARKLAILGGWAFLGFLVYRASQFDYEYANFDPYEILQVIPSATNREIKKAYHKLSLRYHPDKETGDEKLFMKLTKAYEALTDETARKNWELYGNPDGPGAMTFGIALPSWIVEKENSIWILGLYALVFMVALPTVVGIWWYRSIQYSSDAVLLDTTQLYYYFFHKTPSMMLKRALMVLGASMEFEPSHCSEMKSRPSDNEQVPLLMKQFADLGEKTQERPLCYVYSLKARALIWAHLNRYPLPPNTLEKDRQYVVKKSPDLVQEMVTCVSQLIMLAHAKRISRMPTLATIENVMKISPMIVQALWESKSPLLQLPHINEDLLRHFVTKRRNIKSIRQFALLPYDDKRSILRSLNDEEFNNVLNVVKNMPNVSMDVRAKVLDDEDSGKITAKALVTVFVQLKREPMELIMQGAPLIPGAKKKPEKETNEEDDEDGENEDQKPKKPVWQKQKKKSKGGKKSGKKAGGKPQMKNNLVKRNVGAGGGDADKDGSNTPESTPGGEEAKERRQKLKAERAAKAKDKDSGTEESGSEEESGEESGDEEVELQNALDQEKAEKQSSDDDDETEWEKCQDRLAKKEKMKLLEGRARISHPVHCPFFPEEKHEYWWVYICDKRNKRLLTTPLHVTDLQDEEEVQLRFTAPPKPGSYSYTVYLRSDSYWDFDQFKNIKLDVEEAAEIPADHPQWDISDEEEEGEDDESDGGISEFTEDDEDDGLVDEDLSDD